MTLAEMLRHRRSVQHDDAQKPLDSDKVRECLKLAQSAPGSPNMQLYGFYRITGRIRAGQACRSHRAADGGVRYPSGLIPCQGAGGARVRAGQYRPQQPARKNGRPSEKIGGLLRQTDAVCLHMLFRPDGYVAQTDCRHGLFRPITRNVPENDMRIVVHKSCARLRKPLCRQQPGRVTAPARWKA
ncbi:MULTISPECIES: hypothetical protein [unclassified Neisseria]|uniref:hypothetical protein n=1 Tax=unclassified Neisseria TaxID=2623750 RepID=UPI001D168BA2|nr:MULTISPECIES: hypothetical protein [unclassified Neisseria]